MQYTYSAHACQIIGERHIESSLIDECLSLPDKVETRFDGTIHYCKRFMLLEGRWLRVIIN